MSTTAQAKAARRKARQDKRYKKSKWRLPTKPTGSKPKKKSV